MCFEELPEELAEACRPFGTQSDLLQEVRRRRTDLPPVDLKLFEQLYAEALDCPVTDLNESDHDKIVIDHLNFVVTGDPPIYVARQLVSSSTHGSV
ncbi:MAG: hypothetical protein AAB582_02215 [Patescibacteria group bacterium]